MRIARSSAEGNAASFEVFVLNDEGSTQFRDSPDARETVLDDGTQESIRARSR
jgi:hypothetical protein